MSYQAYRPPNYPASTPFLSANGHDASSPVESRHNPFATPFDSSSDNLHLNKPLPNHHEQSNDGYSPEQESPGDLGLRHYGNTRQYGNSIPLQEGNSNKAYDPPPNDPRRGPLVGEAALSQEELARDARRQARQQQRQRTAKNGLLGVGTGRIAWVVYTMTLIQITVFIAELVKMSILTGSPIETKPTFNIMIGPSPYLTINMGARYLPCMKDMTAYNITPDEKWPCPNTTSADASAEVCALSDLCGNGAPAGQYPLNQWWRFISPIFLHVGIIHIAFNMLLQMTLGREIEHLIGSIRFFIVYMACGIFGFILGGNFAARGLSSMGASGSLFGIVALSLLDLIYTWQARQSPGKELIFIMIDIVISLVLGLLPGLDNFSHIGGLLMGLVLGICILRSPDVLRRRTVPTENFDRKHRNNKIYDNKGRIRAEAADYSEFTKGPIGFFRGRTPFWWGWWLVRAGCLVAVIVVFIVLINNFYVYQDTCSWCKYLSCLPITTNGVNWCEIGTAFTQKST